MVLPLQGASPPAISCRPFRPDFEIPIRKLGIRQLKTRNGRSRLLTAIGNAQRCACASRQQELAPTNNFEIPIRSIRPSAAFLCSHVGTRAPCPYFEIPIRLNLCRFAARGDTPLASPRQRAQRTKAPKHLLSCANRPHIARVGLSAAEHVAIEQVHVPRVRRIVRVGSTRPVVERLHAGKGITFGPLARSRRV